jgi:hypothetical protein
MTDYTPTTGDNNWKIVRNAATSSNFLTPQGFDRWLESVKAEERKRIIRQLENIATNIIKSDNEYWEGYVRALEDVRLDNWPLEDDINGRDHRTP